MTIIPISAGWCLLATFCGKKKLKRRFGKLDFSSSERVWDEQLSSKSIALLSSSVRKWYVQKTLRIHHTVIFWSNQAFAWFLFGIGVASHYPSVWSVLDFSFYQLQKVALFSNGWCAHHECNTSLKFRLFHTRIILFVWFININTIWELLIVDTSLVYIVNELWRCIHFPNISTNILAPRWHDYLSLLIWYIICFAVQSVYSCLVVIKCSWNLAWWGFEVINPQAFFKHR